MGKKILRASDLEFFFGGPAGGSTCHIPYRWICGICGRKFYDHALPVVLEEGTEKGPWVGEVCGECLTSSPKRLAELARERAPILRNKRPRRGDDEDTNIRLANDLILVAGLFDTLDSLDEIPRGTLARKIGEAYLELGNPTETRKGKAA